MNTETTHHKVVDGGAGVEPQETSRRQGIGASLVPMIVAVMLLLAYLGISYLLFTDRLNLDTSLWERAMSVYSGFEALVLTAAGYLFGQEVHRTRANHAEQRAEENKQEMIAAIGSARVAQMKAQTLHEAILDSGEPSRDTNKDFVSTTSAEAELVRLRSIAEALTL